MAKIVTEYGLATLLSAELYPEKAAVQSNWRRDYVNSTGRLYLMESEKKFPGQQFLYFVEEDDLVGPDFWVVQPSKLRTSYGTPTIEGNELVFCSNNTRYVFRLNEKE